METADVTLIEMLLELSGKVTTCNDVLLNVSNTLTAILIGLGVVVGIAFIVSFKR